MNPLPQCSFEKRHISYDPSVFVSMIIRPTSIFRRLVVVYQFIIAKSTGINSISLNAYVGIHSQSS